jgi:hypothetical protein
MQIVLPTKSTANPSDKSQCFIHKIPRDYYFSITNEPHADHRASRTMRLFGYFDKQAER